MTRAQRVGDSVLVAEVRGQEVRGLGGLEPRVVWTELDLLGLGLGGEPITVGRLPTLTVWEALATAVLRQVVRAETARARFARLVDAASPDGAFPSPAAVLRCDERAMAARGLRFCWPKLVRLADWSIESGAHEEQGEPTRTALLDAAAGVSGLGPWSLAVATWDLTCDPLTYPLGDFVVQAGASRLFPASAWERTPEAFASEWRSASRSELAALTLLALLAADPRSYPWLRSVLARTPFPT